MKSGRGLESLPKKQFGWFFQSVQFCFQLTFGLTVDLDCKLKNCAWNHHLLQETTGIGSQMIDPVSPTTKKASFSTGLQLILRILDLYILHGSPFFASNPSKVLHVEIWDGHIPAAFAFFILFSFAFYLATFSLVFIGPQPLHQDARHKWSFRLGFPTKDWKIPWWWLLLGGGSFNQWHSGQSLLVEVSTKIRRVFSVLGGDRVV